MVEEGDEEGVLSQVGFGLVRGGSPVGQANNNVSEIEHFLESIRQFLPTIGTKWDLSWNATMDSFWLEEDG